MKKQPINLKDTKEGYMVGFGRGKENGEFI